MIKARVFSLSLSIFTKELMKSITNKVINMDNIAHITISISIIVFVIGSINSYVKYYLSLFILK